MSAFLPRRFARTMAPCAFFAPAAVLLAACGAGCASSGGATYAQSPAVAAYVERAPYRTHIEDDGLPSQPPPSLRIREMPDDPTQPYSRNYGGPNPAALPSPKSPPPAAIKPIIPADLPPAFRRQLAEAGYAPG